MTDFCGDINEYLQCHDFYQSSKTVLRSYILDVSDPHYSFLTSLVFIIQDMILNEARQKVTYTPTLVLFEQA